MSFNVELTGRRLTHQQRLTNSTVTVLSAADRDIWVICMRICDFDTAGGLTVELVTGSDTRNLHKKTSTNGDVVEIRDFIIQKGTTLKAWCTNTLKADVFVTHVISPN